MEPGDLDPLADRLRDFLTDLGPMPMTPDTSARLIRETARAHPDLPPGLIASIVRDVESAARPVMVSTHGPGTEAFALNRFGYRTRALPWRRRGPAHARSWPSSRVIPGGRTCWPSRACR